MFTFFRKKFKQTAKKIHIKGFSKNPFFYLGLISFVLLGLLFSNSDSLARLSYFKYSNAVFFNSFFKNSINAASSDLFFSQNKALSIETPDLKIIQDNFIYGIATPRVLTTQILGSIMGGAEQDEDRKEIIDYDAEIGDTLESIAKKFNISLTTLLLANDLSKNSTLKVGQSLVIPPLDGMLYAVKVGDTISDIAKKYKSSADKIIAFNDLKNEGDIFVNDLIFLPGGQTPPRPVLPATQIPIADSFFIYPTEGIITQGPHGFLGRGVDVANKCGTPVYAAAPGVVQRAQFNARYGNFITISHYNGTSSYYGHEQTVLVKPGETVTAGQMIGLMGKTGREVIGCNLHFEIRGARNFLSNFGVGFHLNFK